MREKNPIRLALVLMGLWICAGCAGESSGASDPDATSDAVADGDTLVIEDTSDGTSDPDVPPGDLVAGDLVAGDTVDATELPEPPELLPDPPDMLGGDRPATYFVPAGYVPEEPLPLLVLLHGYSVDATIQDLYFALSDTTLEMGVFLITPDGTMNAEGVRFWNATESCCNGYGSDVDDVTYILDLVDEASAYFAIDPKRIYLAGHSNGGYMSHRLACDASERIAAIMSLAGTTWEFAEDCGDPEPVSVLHVHGTEDAAILYSGLVGMPGSATIGESDPSACLSASCLAELDACTASEGCSAAFTCALECDHFDCIKACLGAVEEPAQILFSGLIDCAMKEGCVDTGVLGYPGYAGAMETAARWAAINGCGEEPIASLALDLDVAVAGEETSVLDWYGCTSGAEVSLWTMNGVGHLPIFGPQWAPAFVGWLLDQERP